MAEGQKACSKLEDRVRATIYGNCIGDAIGLLSEFMIKKEISTYYGKLKHLEYEHKVSDMHRMRWKTGDWTDDSDQMILIMDSLLENQGKVDAFDFAKRIKVWQHHGFAELGDLAGMGIGATTHGVLNHHNFLKEPMTVAEGIWEAGDRRAAPNGAVMRTSILGLHEYWSIDKVTENAISICSTTHADHRCKASCVAVVTAIAYMLQEQPKHMEKSGKFNIKAIKEDSFNNAKKYTADKQQETELRKHMFAKSISDLKLDERGKIGYTYKTMGAGFWALQQGDFRTALEKIVREGGDADTNGAVAGAMLGCKLGSASFPDTWLNQLLHKDWLDTKLTKFVELVKVMSAADNSASQ